MCSGIHSMALGLWFELDVSHVICADQCLMLPRGLKVVC